MKKLKNKLKKIKFDYNKEAFNSRVLVDKIYKEQFEQKLRKK